MLASTRYRLTTCCDVVLDVAEAISNGRRKRAILQHINRDRVVVHARGLGVDAGETRILATGIWVVLTGALATIAAIEALGLASGE